MIENLVDRDTWFTLCAMGSMKPSTGLQNYEIRGKKVFENHPVMPTQETYKTAWKDCITSIDNQARYLKCRLKEKANKK